MSTYVLDTELAGRIAKAVDRFPVNFSHIVAHEILPVTVYDKKSKAIAEMRHVPLWVRTITKYKIGMVVYADYFDDMPKRVQDLVIIHELEHVLPNDKKPGEYVFKDHDVQDWYAAVGVLGANFRFAQDNPDFDIYESDVEDWKVAVQHMKVETSVPRRRKKRRGK